MNEPSASILGLHFPLPQSPSENGLDDSAKSITTNILEGIGVENRYHRQTVIQSIKVGVLETNGFCGK